MAEQLVPAELRERPQWVVHRAKVPYNPAAPQQRASATLPRTWGTYEQASAVTDADGIGFVFSEQDPFCGVDLDATTADGTVHPEAQRVIAQLNSYTEISPSGRGVHVFLRAELNGGRNRIGDTPWGGGLEVYDRARYFTVTGNVLGEPREIEDRQAELDAVRSAIFPPPTAQEPARVSDVPRRDPETVLAKARAAANGEKFERLWSGDTSGYASDSEADLALCSMLAFWIGPDTAQIDELFARSGLARKKWERADYRKRTIAAALKGAEFYTWPEPIQERNGETANGADPSLPLPPFRSFVVGGGSKDPTAATAVEKDVTPAPPLPLESVGRSARELRDTTPPEPAWLVRGVIAPGWVVKLAAREKTGKGTLAAYLIAKLERCEPTVFGPPPENPVTTLIYTEEPEDSLRAKFQAFNLERASAVFHHELRLLSWGEVAAFLVAKAVAEGHGLIYLDNISRATGTDEEGGVELARKIEPLSDLSKQAGLATLLDHHHRKSGGRIEDLSRGGTAPDGACENNIAMVRRGDWASRERQLFSRGRVITTIWEKTLQLTEDGSDYIEVEDADYRERVLRERAEWTAKDFGAAIARDVSTARRWLNDSPLVTRADGHHGGSGGGTATTLYRVNATDTPTPDQPAI